MSDGCMARTASRAQACPDLSRKRIQGRQTHLERQNRIWTKTGRSNAAVGWRHRACNRRSRLEARRHDGPCLAAGLNVSLGSQQRIGRFNRASCQTQFLGQRACRGNAVTRLQHSAGNGAAKPIVDLAVKRCGRRWIQRRDLAGLCDAHGLANSAARLKAYYIIIARISGKKGKLSHHLDPSFLIARACVRQLPEQADGVSKPVIMVQFQCSFMDLGHGS